MMNRNADAALLRARELSGKVVAAADRGDLAEVADLDAERLVLLQSFRNHARQPAAEDQRLLQEISHLNDRAIGLVEHHRRIKGRAMDMAAVGRRAVTAYARNRAAR